MSDIVEWLKKECPRDSLARDARLQEVADEIETLRNRLVGEKLCHEETRKRLHEVALDWQVLKAELIEIGAALDDPRTDLSMTMAEVIRDLKNQCIQCFSLSTAHYEVMALKKERDHWKANHDNRVAAARLLHYRLDLPLERVKAYEKYVELQEKLAEMESTWLSPSAYEALIQERQETLAELAAVTKERDQWMHEFKAEYKRGWEYLHWWKYSINRPDLVKMLMMGDEL